MKLYAVVGSGNCRKVQATANKLGIDLDVEYLDFFAGELTTPEYLKLNPNGRVPALTDGDFTLWEFNAIMQYLADEVTRQRPFPTGSTNPRGYCTLAMLGARSFQ